MIAKGARVSMICSYEIAFTDKAGRSWEAGLLVARTGEAIERIEDLTDC